jgi:hypothetical protein
MLNEVKQLQIDFSLPLGMTARPHLVAVQRPSPLQGEGCFGRAETG